MKKSNRLNFIKGFSLIEIVVCIGVLTILLSIGFMGFKKHRESRAFQTAFDRLESQVKRAQKEGKAYGVPPEGYVAGSIDNPSPTQNYNYRVVLLNNGLSKAPFAQDYENINISCNFAISPPSESQLSNFRGVGLIFVYSDSGTKYQNMLCFTSSGLPNSPTSTTIGGGLNDSTSKNYEITVAYKNKNGSNIYEKKILINKETGLITTQ